jgi:hypothetical protein
MFKYGKCPKCENLVRKVATSSVVVETATTKYRGISFNCSLCGTVLSVSLDPLLNNDKIWPVSTTKDRPPSRV